MPRKLLQFVSTSRSARRSTSVLYHVFFFFELIFFLYQLSLPVKEKLMKIIPITERERRHTFLDISIFWNFTCKDIQAYCVKTVLKVLAIVRKANETIELCVST